MKKMLIAWLLAPEFLSALWASLLSRFGTQGECPSSKMPWPYQEQRFHHECSVGVNEKGTKTMTLVFLLFFLMKYHKYSFSIVTVRLRISWKDPMGSLSNFVGQWLIIVRDRRNETILHPLSNFFQCRLTEIWILIELKCLKEKEA